MTGERLTESLTGASVPQPQRTVFTAADHHCLAVYIPYCHRPGATGISRERFAEIAAERGSHNRTVPSPPPEMMTPRPSRFPNATVLYARALLVRGLPRAWPERGSHNRTVPSPPPVMITSRPSRFPNATARTVPVWPTVVHCRSWPSGASQTWTVRLWLPDTIIGWPSTIPIASVRIVRLWSFHKRPAHRLAREWIPQPHGPVQTAGADHFPAVDLAQRKRPDST